MDIHIFIIAMVSFLLGSLTKTIQNSHRKSDGVIQLTIDDINHKPAMCVILHKSPINMCSGTKYVLTLQNDIIDKNP